MPKTRKKCKEAGIYVSDCSDRERITMPLGHQFPDCPVCKEAVKWKLAVATKE